MSSLAKVWGCRHVSAIQKYHPNSVPFFETENWLRIFIRNTGKILWSLANVARMQEKAQSIQLLIFYIFIFKFRTNDIYRRIICSLTKESCRECEVDGHGERDSCCQHPLRLKVVYGLGPYRKWLGIIDNCKV